MDAVYNQGKQDSLFDDFFDKQYYSHLFGKRKPDKDAFVAILNENSLNPDETLFVDDSLQNILGAEETGLHVIHLTNEKSIFSVLEYIHQN